MTNWIVSLRCSIPLRESGIALFLMVLAGSSVAQPAGMQYSDETDSRAAFMQNQTDTVPEPGKVVLRSLIIPGWGQLTNKQVWKIPIVYGLLAGVTYYSITQHQQYTGYRAAYYNSHSDDQEFGPTPRWIDPAHTSEALRANRDYYRGRRDFAFLGIFLAYGLNVADAYVFAQFRDFDVSDDLSARVGFKPEWTPDQNPFISVSLNFFY
ncbi:MAG: DUF5683 domain-containing protein [Balneolales bacterium]